MKRKRLENTIQETNKSSKAEISDPLLEVFSNDSIFQRLEKLLSLADLKNLRLVNSLFNSNVILRTTFTSRIYFTINKELISSRTLENIGFPIKKARVHCFRPDSSWIRVCKKGCCTSHFHKLSSVNEIEDEQEVRRKKGLPPPSKIWDAEEIEHIYDALRCVEDLGVHCPYSEFVGSCLCDARNESTFPLFPSVNRIIESNKKSLKELKLSTIWVKHVLGDYAGILGYRLKKLTLLRIYELCMQLPESLMALQNLETFKVEPRWDLDEADYAVINGLVAGNAKSLQSLSLGHMPISKDKFLTCLKSTKFSQLKHLQIRFGKSPTDVIEFLRDHKDVLQTLSLHYDGYAEPIPVELLQMFSTIPNLSKLDMSTTSRIVVNMEHFDILKNCTALQCIQVKIKRYVSDEEPGLQIPQMFNYLPASARRLSLLGYAAFGGPALSEVAIRAVPHLTSLELLDCYAAVTNETLQAIFTNWTMLKELVLTHARACNHEGFIGNASSTSASIKNLTCLEKLILRDCNLTDAVVFEAFEFPRLTHLDISWNEALTSSLRLRYLLNRNPALEVLRLNKFHRVHQKDYVSELRKLYPGLRLLQIKPPTELNPDYKKFLTL